MSFLSKGSVCLLLALLCLPARPLPATAAQTPYDIDVRDLDRVTPPRPAPAKEKIRHREKRPTHRGRRGHRASRVRKGHAPRGYARYTVRPEDNLYKILMVHFGMSNEEADRLVPQVLRVNGGLYM